MQPFVSICIPVYNGEKYLRFCLDSVIAQTFLNIEIIIVDDDSSDDSREIIKEYALKDARIRMFFNEVNSGLVSNWNRCLEYSTGTWIKYVFQDDVLNLNCIERMMQFSSDDNPIIVCNRNFLIEDSASPDLKSYFNKRVATLLNIMTAKKGVKISPAQISKLAVKKISVNFIGEPTCVLFRRDIVDKVGYFDPCLVQICDLEYWLRIATAFGLLFIPEKLVSFRVHDKSTTSKNIYNKDGFKFLSDPILFADKLLNDQAYESFRLSMNFWQMKKIRFFLRVRLFELEALLKSAKAGGENGKLNKVLHMLKTYDMYKGNELLTKIFYKIVQLKRMFV